MYIMFSCTHQRSSLVRRVQSSWTAHLKLTTQPALVVGVSAAQAIMTAMEERQEELVR